MTRRMWVLGVSGVLLIVAVIAGQLVLNRPPAPRPTGRLVGASYGGSIGVAGNRLVDANGNTLRLLGVNRSGTEFACIQGWGLFDGPSDAGSIASIASWKGNAVRVPLNEDCWLNINGVRAAYAGANYQQAIVAYVNRLHAAGQYVILDLHWAVAGTKPATYQTPMPDADHAPAFWKSVATTFKHDPAVLFNLFNEPYGVDWSCWLSGCSSPGYQAAGMQQLVDAVRSTGATQPIMLGGLDYANDESAWLANRPRDPRNALVMSFHAYNFKGCQQSCWDSQIAPVAARVPVVTDEIGQNNCATDYIDQLMPWLDNLGISYLGWTWNTWNCSGGPALISNYDGTPTAFGAGYKKHLADVARASSGSSTGTPAGANGASLSGAPGVAARLNRWRL